MRLRPTHLAAALILVPAIAVSAQTLSPDNLSPGPSSADSSLGESLQANSGTSDLQLTAISDNAVPDLRNVDAILQTGPPSSAPTPEPSSLVLLATGMAGLTAAYRRRRRS